MTDTWVGIGEAAALTGVPTSAIQRWTKEGRLPHAVTPGGHRRYRVADLARIVGLKHPRVVVYTPQRFWPPEDKGVEKLVKLIGEAGLQPAYKVEERQQDLTRPLPTRPGFQQIAKMAGDGRVQGFAISHSSMVGGKVIAPWLGICAKLGLICWAPDESRGGGLCPYPRYPRWAKWP